MGRYFNIGGPCNPADHYTLSAMARLPRVVSLIGKKQYFVRPRVIGDLPDIGAGEYYCPPGLLLLVK